MKIDPLKDCITTLVDLRNAYNGQLDASVVDRLDEVINELQGLNNSKAEVNVYVVGTKALQIIADVLSVVSNLTDLM